MCKCAGALGLTCDFARLTLLPAHADLSLCADPPPRLRKNTSGFQKAHGKGNDTAGRRCELGTGDRPASASDGRILDREAGFHLEVHHFELGHDRDNGQNVHRSDEDTRGRGDDHETTAGNMVY